MIRIKGEFLLNDDNPQIDIAEGLFIKALEIAGQHGAKSWQLRAAMSLAGLWLSQEKHAQARDLVCPIFDWFTEGFDTRDLREAKRLIERLS